MSTSLLGNSGMQGNTGMRGPSGTSAGQNPAGYNVTQLSNFSPEQQQLFQQLFSHLGPQSYTSRLAQGDQSLFGEIEAPAHRQFQGLQSQLASQFSGAGLGGRRSSGFQNAANQQTADFAQQLQSQRQGLQQQAIRDLLGMGSQLLSQRSFENIATPKPKSMLEELLIALSGGIGKGLGAGAGSYLAGKF